METAGMARKSTLTLDGEFAGHQRLIPLWQVLRGGDVVSGDLRLLRRCCRELLVLHLGFGHVIVTRVKVFLLQGITTSLFSINELNFKIVFQKRTPFCSLFRKRSDPPGLAPRWGYRAFSLTSSAFSGLTTVSCISCIKCGMKKLNHVKLLKLQQLHWNKQYIMNLTT